jgi:hypothetical protein
MLKLQGPVANVTIANIDFDGVGYANVGILVEHVTNLTLDNVTVRRFTDLGYKFTTTNPSSSYGTCDVQMFNVNALEPVRQGGFSSSADGMLFDGNTNSILDTCRVRYIGGIVHYGGGTGSSGIELRYTDSNMFKQVLISCYPFNGSGNGCEYSGGAPILFSSPGGSLSGFPYGNVFDQVFWMFENVSGTSGTLATSF